MTHDSRTQAVMAEEAWWQECEVASHTASTVGKQRETNAGLRLHREGLHSSTLSRGILGG